MGRNARRLVYRMRLEGTKKYSFGLIFLGFHIHPIGGDILVLSQGNIFLFIPAVRPGIAGICPAHKPFASEF
jgi:hypothetical protein